MWPSYAQDKLRKKAPASQYAQLEAQGVKVHFGNPTDPAALPKGPFDYVYDNNGKVGCDLLQYCSALQHCALSHVQPSKQGLAGAVPTWSWS